LAGIRVFVFPPALQLAAVSAPINPRFYNNSDDNAHQWMEDNLKLKMKNEKCKATP